VLAYDDVLNIQRQSIYQRRRALLSEGDAALEQELSRLANMKPEFAGQVENKKKELGDAFYPIVRRFLLQTIDYLWVEHLEAMEYLRSSVNLRAYGQRDPLVEYKKEGLRLFQTMEDTYAQHVMQSVPNINTGGAPASRQERSVATAARSITATGQAGPRKEYGRNDKVTITNGTETKEMKYKKAESLLQTGEWRILE